MLNTIYSWLVSAKHGTYQASAGNNFIDDIVSERNPAGGVYSSFKVERDEIVYKVGNERIRLYINNPFSNFFSYVSKAGCVNFILDTGGKSEALLAPRFQFVFVNIGAICFFGLFSLFILYKFIENPSVETFIFSLISGIPVLAFVAWLRYKSHRIMKLAHDDIDKIEKFLAEKGVTIKWNP